METQTHKQCQWFGGQRGPEKNIKCTRPGKLRPQFSMTFYTCDVHGEEALYGDAEDWSFRIMRDMRRTYFKETHASGQVCVYMPEIDEDVPWRVIERPDDLEIPPRHIGCLAEHITPIIDLNISGSIAKCTVSVCRMAQYVDGGVYISNKDHEGCWMTEYVLMASLPSHPHRPKTW